MRALGSDKFQITTVFLIEAIVVGIVGALLGSIFGFFLGGILIQMIAENFNVPPITFGVFALMMLFIVFYSPESLIMTKHQLLHVYKLFELLEERKKFEKKPGMPLIYSSLDIVVDYLDKLDRNDEKIRNK